MNSDSKLNIIIRKHILFWTSISTDSIIIVEKVLIQYNTPKCNIHEMDAYGKAVITDLIYMCMVHASQYVL